MRTLRVAMAQINSVVGDLQNNKQKISDYILKAKDLGADIVSFPELAICGYPPEDLILKHRFVKENKEVIKLLASEHPEIVIIVGFVDFENDNIYNAAAVLFEGKIQGIYHKKHLPNYGVFDERRYFQPGDRVLSFSVNSVVVGVNICEDIWHDEPTAELVRDNNAEIIININSSPYALEKYNDRKNNLSERCKANNIYIAYNNLVGGQDELVFDGGSIFVNPQGEVIKSGLRFKEDLVIKDIDFIKNDENTKEQRLNFNVVSNHDKDLAKTEEKIASREEEIYSALVLGLKDYVWKNNFSKALIALSGGVDSALSLAIAVDALGAQNVLTIYLPSDFSSNESGEDARQCAKNFGVELKELPISELYDQYLKDLKPFFNDLTFNETEENIQARIRGNIVMAFSNKFGYIVLSTGNKSELSVGYATLYGDMAGGFSVLKDVYKTEVYKLCEYVNTGNKIIPERIITKAPSAELRHDQKDQDSLPPYDLLDAILKLYVEEYKTANEIIEAGYEKEIVQKVVRMVDTNEYKRRQGAPGIKITTRAFGRDRRMPITQGYLGKSEKLSE